MRKCFGPCVVAWDLFFQTLAFLGCLPGLGQSAFYSANFDSGVPSEFSGQTTTSNVQGYSGVWPSGNKFGGNLLWNKASGNPAASTLLTLTGLPAHSSINVEFLL